MKRFRGHRLLKSAVLLAAVFFTLMLALCEATTCQLDCGQCPMTVCCIPSIIPDNAITHNLVDLPYPLYAIKATPEQFCSAIFHPPRA